MSNLIRTDSTPWMVVNLMTDEIVGYYQTDTIAGVAHAGEPVSIQYRPKPKRKAKRSFP